MPTALDRCSSCRQPVYAEEGVSGGCNCPDHDLRVLLAEQRLRNNKGNPDFAASLMAPVPALAEVDPGLLMSAAGRNEFEAARSLTFQAVQGVRTREAAMFDDVANWGPPGQPEPVPPQDDEIQLGGDDDWTGEWQDRPRHNARVASVAARMDQVDLAAMWMQGTGIPFDRAQLATPDHLDDFQFDTGDLGTVDVSNYPRGGGGGGSGGRFRVDQPTPPRAAFNRGLVNDQGPMREAGRARGFAILRETGPGAYQRPAAPPASLPTPTPPSPYERPAPVSAVEQARALQSRPRGPSVYDLIRNSPLRK